MDAELQIRDWHPKWEKEEMSGIVLAWQWQEVRQDQYLHDCDKTYDRRLLAKLFYPVVNPLFNFEFAKDIILVLQTIK